MVPPIGMRGRASRPIPGVGIDESRLGGRAGRERSHGGSWSFGGSVFARSLRWVPFGLCPDAAFSLLWEDLAGRLVNCIFSL